VLHLGVCAAALSALGSGCSTGLPHVRTRNFELRIAPIPEGATPVFSWSGSRDDLKTYWGDQEISFRVSAWLPDDWRNAGDGRWRVEGRNAEGKPIPFLGVIHTDISESGSKTSVLIPPLDLSRVPDGLYVAIIPEVKLEGGRIVTVQPAAMLYEIRNHAFKPFRVRIPLAPARESELTPPPIPLPKKPVGSPIPVD